MFWGKSYYTVFGDSHIDCVPISGITEVEDIFPASVVVSAFHDLQAVSQYTAYVALLWHKESESFVKSTQKSLWWVFKQVAANLSYFP